MRKPFRTVQVELPGCSYPVFVGHGLLARAGELLGPFLGTSSCALVSDATVWKLHSRALLAGIAPRKPVQAGILPPGERSKTLASAGKVHGALLAAGCDRRTALLAFGGGVVGDLAGFVAATYMRGIPFVQVPTTLLAMADSSVGGKVAVNHPRGKNVIGAFHQPRAVLADLDTLATLSRRELASGAVEAIKYGLLGDEELLRHCRRRPLADWDLAKVVTRSVLDKAAVVAVDERETGPRRQLNLGHTLGHALESATAYRRYLHGEAVALGTLFAMRLSVLTSRATEREFDRLLALYSSLGLPLELPPVRFGRLLELMRHDKKAAAGKLLWVLPLGAGGFEEAEDLPEPLLGRAYGELWRALAAGA
jgi:3-dehydroquinate synthase